MIDFHCFLLMTGSTYSIFLATFYTFKFLSEFYELQRFLNNSVFICYQVNKKLKHMLRIFLLIVEGETAIDYPNSSSYAIYQKFTQV